MEPWLKDIAYILLIIVSGVVAFITGRFKLKEYFRDKVEEIYKELIDYKELNNQKISDLKIKIKEQENKDAMQQLVIDNLTKQMDKFTPILFAKLQDKLKENEREN